MTAVRCVRHGWMVAIVLCACVHAPRPTYVPPTTTRPLVGAIRWDAWVGDTPEMPGYDVGLQVERSLGPKQWHDRLPFFAQEISDTEVRVRANTQAVMDREIGYAARAGIDYWAFVMYAPSDPVTKGGLDLYLKSTHRREIRFAMIVQSYTFGHADIDRLVSYFALPDYQRVAGGRPLVFVLGPTKRGDSAWSHPKESIDELRAKTEAAGIASPYIVHQWGWAGAKDVVDWLGLDAMGAYAMQFDDERAPYTMLARKTEGKWDEWAATGARVVPIVMAGWDRRPRVQHPVSWERKGGGPIERYYETPTPSELAAHLRASLEWCRAHPRSAEANTVLVYAWNEIDEGGWLVPSLWPDQGARRLEAIRDVLRQK